MDFLSQWNSYSFTFTVTLSHSRKLPSENAVFWYWTASSCTGAVDTLTLEMISAGRGRIVLFPTYILPKGQSKARHIVRKAVKWAQINA